MLECQLKLVPIHLDWYVTIESITGRVFVVKIRPTVSKPNPHPQFLSGVTGPHGEATRPPRNLERLFKNTIRTDSSTSVTSGRPDSDTPSPTEMGVRDVLLGSHPWCREMSVNRGRRLVLVRLDHSEHSKSLKDVQGPLHPWPSRRERKKKNLNHPNLQNRIIPLKCDLLK